MNITTKKAAREDGGTAFNGPCGQACFAVNAEGECVADCPNYEVRCGTEKCNRDEC